MAYEKPTVVDYGSLAEVTAATTIFGPEDGASKLTQDNHHSLPIDI